MPVFNPRLDVRPDTFKFSGARRDKSFADSRFRGPFSDAEEAELALELLQVTSETQFDRFLGNLFKKVWGGGIAPVGSKVTGPLRGLLKTVASKALPSVATAAATSFGPANDAIAENLGSLVSRALEAEVAAPTGAEPRFGEVPEIVREAPAICAIGRDGHNRRGSGTNRSQSHRGGAEEPGGFGK